MDDIDLIASLNERIQYVFDKKVLNAFPELNNIKIHLTPSEDKPKGGLSIIFYEANTNLKTQAYNNKEGCAQQAISIKKTKVGLDKSDIVLASVNFKYEESDIFSKAEDFKEDIIRQALFSIVEEYLYKKDLYLSISQKYITLIPNLPNEKTSQFEKALVKLYIKNTLYSESMPYYVINNRASIRYNKIMQPAISYFNQNKYREDFTAILPQKLNAVSMLNATAKDNIGSGWAEQALVKSRYLDRDIHYQGWTQGVLFEVIECSIEDIDLKIYKLKVNSLNVKAYYSSEKDIVAGTPLYLTTLGGALIKGVVHKNISGEDIANILLDGTIIKNRAEYSKNLHKIKKLKKELKLYDVQGKGYQQYCEQKIRLTKKKYDEAQADVNLWLSEKSILEMNISAFRKEHGFMGVYDFSANDEDKLSKWNARIKLIDNLVTQKLLIVDEWNKEIKALEESLTKDKKDVITLLQQIKAVSEKIEKIDLTQTIEAKNIDIYVHLQHYNQEPLALCGTPWLEEEAEKLTDDKIKDDYKLPVCQNIALQNIFYYPKEALNGLFVDFKQAPKKEKIKEKEYEGFEIKSNTVPIYLTSEWDAKTLEQSLIFAAQGKFAVDITKCAKLPVYHYHFEGISKNPIKQKYITKQLTVINKALTDLRALEAKAETIYKTYEEARLSSWSDGKQDPVKRDAAEANYMKEYNALVKEGLEVPIYGRYADDIRDDIMNKKAYEFDKYMSLGSGAQNYYKICVQLVINIFQEEKNLLKDINDDPKDASHERRMLEEKEIVAPIPEEKLKKKECSKDNLDLCNTAQLQELLRKGDITFQQYFQKIMMEGYGVVRFKSFFKEALPKEKRSLLYAEIFNKFYEDKEFLNLLGKGNKVATEEERKAMNNYINSKKRWGEYFSDMFSSITSYDTTDNNTQLRGGKK